MMPSDKKITRENAPFRSIVIKDLRRRRLLSNIVRLSRLVQLI